MIGVTVIQADSLAIGLAVVLMAVVSVALLWNKDD